MILMNKGLLFQLAYILLYHRRRRQFEVHRQLHLQWHLPRLPQLVLRLQIPLFHLLLLLSFDLPVFKRFSNFKNIALFKTYLRAVKIDKTLLCVESVYQFSQTQNRYRQGRPKTDLDSALSSYHLIFLIKIFFANFE